VPMNSRPERWRDVLGKFKWWIWSWFGWWALFAFVVCAWIALNADPQKAALSFLFGAAALVFGVLSLGCFVAAFVGFIQWAWTGVRRLRRSAWRS
jgi:hypothetical protein